MPVTYTVSLSDLHRVRGDDARLSFDTGSPEAMAAQMQHALRETALFDCWLGIQSDPESINPLLGATDAQATVTGRLDQQRILLAIRTALPAEVLKHRLHLLAGSHWELRDVRL